MNTTHLEQVFSSQMKDTVLRKDFNNVLPFPKFSDRNAWNAVRNHPRKKDLAESMIRTAEKIRTEPIPQTLFSRYSEFRANGNRSHYEDSYFQKRNRLATMAMALCLTGDLEQYRAPILDSIASILEERCWCVPAHARYSPDSAEVYPDRSSETLVDLFAAETAGMLGLLFHLLEAEIRSFSDAFADSVRAEVVRRVIRPVLDRVPFWWYDGYNNWTPWCCANILTSGICLLDSAEDLRALIETLNAYAGRYDARSPEDGFCDEGPMYWGKSAMEYYRYLRQLEILIPGSATPVLQSEKLRKMLDFVAQCRIAGPYFQTFGDTGFSRISRRNAEMIFNMSQTVHSPLLAEFSCLCRNRPEPEFDTIASTGEYLQLYLPRLFVPEEFWNLNLSSSESGKTSTVFPDRLAILRDATGFSTSLKAGNNAENHNHNDLGHFSLFDGEHPLILDVGATRYRKEHFNDQRYTIWCLRGSGHNAPVFGADGEQLSSTDSTAALTPLETLPGGVRRISADLSHAYPESCGVQSLMRTLEAGHDFLTVHDQISLRTAKPVSLTLFTPDSVEQTAPGEFRFSCGVRLSAPEMESAEITAMENTDPRMRDSWGPKMTKLVLKTHALDYVLKFQK